MCALVHMPLFFAFHLFLFSSFSIVYSNNVSKIKSNKCQTESVFNVQGLSIFWSNWNVASCKLCTIKTFFDANPNTCSRFCIRTTMSIEHVNEVICGISLPYTISSIQCSKFQLELRIIYFFFLLCIRVWFFIPAQSAEH